MLNASSFPEPTDPSQKTVGYQVISSGGKYLFISYSRANLSAAERLRGDLQSAGVNLWIDKVGLKPGTPDWEQALRDAIARSDGVLLIASPQSRRSPYVRDEIAIAKMHKKPIFPIWVEGTDYIDSIPMGMSYVQNVDIRGDGYANGLTQLLSILAADQLAAPPEIAPEAGDAAPSAPPAHKNPYKGLTPFRETDRAFFFGRGDVVKSLAEALTSAAFMAIVGASGSGKSSVVMAGLLPALRDGAIPNSGAWRYIDPFVPGTHPLENLTIALARYFPDKSMRAIREDLEDRSTRGLHTLARQLGATGESRCVLYVDQFEELYTLTTDAAERQRFIDLITTAVSEPNPAVTVIISLRADFYDRPLNDQALGRLLQAHTHNMLPMTLADLYDVVQKPADLVGLTFDEGLVSELVFTVREEPGALPLLQFTLEQLYARRDGDRLTFAAYRALGGLRGALAQHAEQTYAALPDEAHQRLARALFLRLIEPGATEQATTRRRAALSELSLPDAQESARYRAAADAFIEARLLTADRIGGVDTLEVSHEAVIREWRRLGEWINTARADVLAQRAVTAAAAEWEQYGRSPDLLYRGVQLAEAVAWAARNTPSSQEHAFLDASTDYAMRARRTRRLLIGAGVGIVLLIPLLLAAFFFDRSQREADNAQALGTQAALALTAEAESESRRVEAVLAGQTSTFALGESQQRGTQAAAAAETSTYALGQAEMRGTLAAAQAATAEYQGEVARSLALAAQSGVERLGLLPDRAVLLALEALERFPYTWQAERALGEAVLNYRTERVFPVTEFTPDQNSAQLSPNGQRVLTLNTDESATIWDLQSNSAIHLPAPITRAAWSNSGEYIAALDDQGVPTVYNSSTGDALHRLIDHRGRVTVLAWSPEGARLVTGGEDGTARVWDAAAGSVLAIMREQDSAVVSAAWSPDGMQVVTGGEDASAVVWGAANGEVTLPRLRTPAGSPMTYVGWSSDGTRIHTYAVTARSWDAKTGRLVYEVEGFFDGVNSAAWSPDESVLLTTGFDGTTYWLRLWDGQTGAEIRPLHYRPDAIYRAVWSPDGTRIVFFGDDDTARVWDMTRILTTALDGTARLWNANEDIAAVVLITEPGWSTVSAWSIDSFQLAIIDEFQGNLNLWDSVSQRSRSLVINQSLHPFGDLRWAASDQVLIHISTLTDPLIARIWNAWDGTLIFSTSADEGEGMVRYALSHDNSRLLALLEDASLHIWDTANGQALLNLSIDGELPSLLGWTTDNRPFAVTVEDGQTRVWDVQTGETLITSDHALPRYTRSSNSDWILLHGDGFPTVQPFEAWNLATGAHLNLLDIGSVYAANWSPDGRWLLMELASESIMVDSARGEIALTFPSWSRDEIIWSPDSTRFATRDNEVEVWDAQTGERLLTLVGHTDFLASVEWSPNGERILTGSRDGTARVWDARTGAELLVLDGHQGTVTARWSPDGRSILTSSGDRLRVWNAWQSLPDLIAYAHECCAAQALTDAERAQFGLPPRTPTPTPAP